MTTEQPPQAPLYWQSDFLGEGFQQHSIELGNDPDGETDVFATVVRYKPDSDEQFFDRPAVLWVHGMTDYFFHAEFAEFFHQAGFAVYAVDLRKCGRSHRAGQRWHYTTDLTHYFPDLSSAVEMISQHHPEVFPIAHSTGGLIVPLWAAHVRETDPELYAKVSGIVLNSPWLDMMYPKAFVRAITPVVNVLGKYKPTTLIPGGGLGTYGRSLHKDFYGEWEFDNHMKPVEGHTKCVGWLRAVMAGHALVHKDEINVGVDVLTLHSQQSWLKPEYSEKTNTSDAVLDVKQIARWAPHISSPSSKVTVIAIKDARHDVFLSRKPARDNALKITLDWLQNHSVVFNR